MLDFAVFKIYPDKCEVVTSIGHWESLRLKPGCWHVMAQGIESATICKMTIGQEATTFNPQSEVPLALPVLYLRVKVEEETPIELEVKSTAPYTLYITQLWDL